MPSTKIKKHVKSLLAAVLEGYIFFYQKKKNIMRKHYPYLKFQGLTTLVESITFYKIAKIMLLNLQQFMKLLK